MKTSKDQISTEIAGNEAKKVAIISRLENIHLFQYFGFKKIQLRFGYCSKNIRQWKEQITWIRESELKYSKTNLIYLLE